MQYWAINYTLDNSINSYTYLTPGRRAIIHEILALLQASTFVIHYTSLNTWDLSNHL